MDWVLIYQTWALVGDLSLFGGPTACPKLAALLKNESDFAKQLLFGLPLLRQFTEFEGQ